MNFIKNHPVDYSAVIAGTHLIAFPGLSAERKQDIIDLMMYADFYASQTWRREEQWTSWIQYYQAQLLTSGCKLRSAIVKPPMYITDASELDHVGIGITGTINVNNLLDLAQRSFKAARISQFARHFFEFGTASGSRSAFLMVPCERLDADDVSILLCGLHAKATINSESRGGDWRTNREMLVRLSGGVYSFSQQAYSERREVIRRRLNDVARYNLQGINI